MIVSHGTIYGTVCVHCECGAICSIHVATVLLNVFCYSFNFIHCAGLYLGTSDRGGQTGFHRIKGGVKPLSVCASTHEAGGVWGHAPPENFGILELFRLCLVHSWKQ